MQRLKTEEIISSIQKGHIFSAISDDNAFSITIDKYVPFYCTAIHNGGNFIKSLLDKLALTKTDRWLEEDPYTGVFIESMPIRITVYDSRYLYDLNRDEHHALYHQAWGKDVWKTPLTDEENDMLVTRHRRFYQVIDALTGYLKLKFGAVCVYDIHSYNHQRHDNSSELPLFNVGTERINRKKYSPVIDNWLSELSGIGEGTIINTTAENEIFYGRGYLLDHLTQQFPGVLVLATEIKKIYVDETTGDEFPQYIDIIREGLKRSIISNAALFASRETTLALKQKYRLLASDTDHDIRQVDQQLYRLVKNFEVLHYVNPVNLEQAKRKFLQSKKRKDPEFRYRPLPRRAHDLRRHLYALPLDSIRDISLRQLYGDIVEHHVKLVDMLISRGTDGFRYNSLMVYGEPTLHDMENARFILYCNDIPEQPSPLLSPGEVINAFREKLNQFDPSFQVEQSKTMTARAMILNSKRTLMVRSGLSLTQRQVEALRVHEIGLHVATTLNGENQPLQILRYGLPGYTETQEGMALLAEHLAGLMTTTRLKTLALRTCAVHSMLKGDSFTDVFNMLMETSLMDENEAFYLAARVFRGGGFTKDYLYLRGLVTMYRYNNTGKDMRVLMCGKMSLPYMETVRELLSRKIITTPRFSYPAGPGQGETDDHIEYIISSLK